jgi:hypothetical protein
MRILVPTPNLAVNATLFHADLLDDQRKNVLTAFRAMKDSKHRHHSHPTVLQWKDYPGWLGLLGMYIATERLERGYDKDKTFSIIEEATQGCNTVQPDWWEDPTFHMSHQALLVRKWPELYREVFPDVAFDLPFVYPGDRNAVEQYQAEIKRIDKQIERLQAKKFAAEHSIAVLTGDDDDT